MKQGKPGMSEDQAERVRSAMRTRRDVHHDGNATRLAEELGVRQPTISQILSGKNKPSYPLAQNLARLLGISQDDLLDGRAPTDRYPNRTIARAFAVGIGLLAAAIAEVDSMVLHSEVDPHPDVWLELYRGADQRLRLSSGSPDDDRAEDRAARAHTAKLVKAGKPRLPGRK